MLKLTLIYDREEAITTFILNPNWQNNLWCQHFNYYVTYLANTNLIAQSWMTWLKYPRKSNVKDQDVLYVF